MNCPNCHEDIETGAAFCGNCGQPLQLVGASTKTVSEIAQILHTQAQVKQERHGHRRLAMAGAGTLPSYAFTTPNQHVGELKALLSLLLGVAGIIGALFMPILGLSLAASGIVLGTLARHSLKWFLSTIGLVVSSLAVLFSIGAWTYNIKHNPVTEHQKVNSSGVVTTAVVSTPCYTTNFTDKLNIQNNKGSCDMIAFNGPTMDESTNAYKVYANQAQNLTVQDFTSVAKQALEKDVKDSLPGFTITDQKVTQFAGSPAYAVNTYNKEQGVTVIEEAVLHQVKNGQNVFILVHATNDTKADMTTLEGQWQWK